MTVVPFFCAAGDPERQLWLATLQAGLPDCKVLYAADCTESEKRAAEVAIVATPRPAGINAFPGLKWIQSLWAGVEALLAAPELAHLPVVRLIDPALAETMSEAVLAWTLYLHRDMPGYREQQSQRRWRALPMVRAGERPVGVLGCGELGRAAIGKLLENGFPVSAWSRSPKTIAGVRHHHGQNGLEAMLTEVDIVVCLLPLTLDTRHLLDGEKLGLMKQGAQLINFGRGGLIDTDALLRRLDEGRLKHAVLDVFETEPLPADSVVWAHPSITVLPHISAPTNVATASAIAAANLQDWFEKGRMPAAVNRSVGY
ncbi:MAG: glyoxylate/hydroxypyruvate reductase A [Gammaproteobacteria bacterium]|nr:glyoxylate/hydroxypyruvate reductase A [Gammaproteobacteria bacterium]